MRVYKLWRVCKNLCILMVYLLEYLVPRKKNLWIIGDRYGLKYSDNSRAVYEYVISHESDIKIVWITRNKKVYDYIKSKGGRVAYANSLYGVYIALRAGWVIVDVSTQDVNRYFINGAKIVNLTHGVPIKNAGYADLDRLPSKYVKWYMKFFPFRNEFLANYVISTASFFDPYWPLEFNNRKIKIWTIGYPRNDIFFQMNQEDKIISRIKLEYPNALIVIYLPTFRGDGSSFAPFEQFEFNVDEFVACLERNNLVFLIKAHPGQKSSLAFRKYNRIIELKDTPLMNANTLLNKADVLVTDYSGAYYDYLCLRRPVILAPFDYDDYVCNSRTLYVDYFNDIVGIKAYSWKELIRIFDQKMYFVPSDNIIQKYNKYLDANSAKRVVQNIKSC